MVRLNIFKHFLALFGLVIFLNVAHAGTPPSEEIWLQTFVNARFKPNWGLAFDMGHRRNHDFVKDYLQGFVRLGAQYFFKKHSFVVGFPFFETNLLPEYRPYQRLILGQKWGALQVSHPIRLEQRFRTNPLGQDFFNFRTGYQINLQYPLKGKKIEHKIPFLIFQDELFINFGASIPMHTFDQNRILLGVGSQLGKNWVLHMGYQYSTVQNMLSDEIRHTHALRLNLVFNIDLSQSKE
jgi:hypothetical protein